MNDRTQDAILHKHDKPDSTSNELLDAAMKAEAEIPSQVVHAKAINATDDTNLDTEITSVQKQLTSMTEILKSAHFQGKNQKGKGGATTKATDAREGLKGPETSSAGPFMKGTEGAEVPYHGYVELRLKIPQIKKLDLDILMLVINNSLYDNRIPVQIGTLHIDMMLDLASKEEKKRLNRQAERARMAQNLRMASLHSDGSKDSFDIKGVKESVHSTGKIELKPFDVITVSGVVKGPVKGSGFYKQVNVALEPTDENKAGKSLISSVPGYTFLKSGSNRVQVMLKNMSARPVTLQPGDQLANLEAANAVPHMLAPKGVPNGTNRDLNHQFEQGAQTDVFEEPVRSDSSEEELRPEMDRTPLSD